jgi:ketosteroid isomerase-like protein
MTTTNEQLLTTFYTAFQQRDYKTMQACYANDATFSDEVFVNLNATEVKAMWEMLCLRGKDLQLDFSNIKVNAQTGSAQWKATYSFSKTNRKVVNRIKAEFTFENGKIKRHTDHFNFYSWTRQAIGLPGLLFGWTKAFKEKVRSQARKGLADFMNKQ